MREFFQADPKNPMTAAIVKEFGLYPPGVAVRLKSGELGIATRRGEKTNALIVAVAMVVPLESVRVRMAADRLAQVCAA